MKIKKKKNRRSDFKVMTKEAKVLKFLREDRRLSMRKAGQILGTSDAFVNHSEHGRIDLTPVHSGHILYTLYRRHSLHF